MAVIFKVNPAQLLQQAEELRSLNDRFKTEVQAMTEKEEALSGMWEGEARNAFHNAYASDAQQFQAFYNSINRFIQALSEDAQTYQKAEASAAAVTGSKA
ncbi:MAG: WXG100 family type VII secretion target [Eubacteriales bacterium]|nr:WXG100 family type VII secretion target [Eubacteriales bacterium]